MKKVAKFLLIIVLLIAAINVFSNISRADGEVVDVSTETEFKTALSSGGSIKLLNDITVNANVAASKALVIDLNGNTIDMTSKTLLSYSDLTIKDTSEEQTGKIKSTASFVIQIGGTNRVGKLVLDSGTIEATTSYGIRNLANCTLTINGGTIRGKYYLVYNQSECTMNGGTILATDGLAFQNYKNSTFTMNGGTIKTEADYQALNLYSDCSVVINGGEILAPKDGDRYNGNGIAAFKNTELTINGGTIHSYGIAILGNGSIDGNNEGKNAKFNINGGTIISDSALGIYAPSPNGVTTITGGTITGKTGVEVRAGTLNISGGTFNADTTELTVRPNTSGSNILGAAVAVVQHTTKLPLEVNITGGTFIGYAGVYERNVMGNPQEDIEKITYSISGGDFTATGGETIDVEDYTADFITGGKFTHKVTEYVANGYGEIAENSKVAVYKYITVTANQGTNGTLTIKRSETKLDDGTVVSNEETSTNTLQALKGDKIEVAVDSQNDFSLLTLRETEEGQATKTVTGNNVDCGTLDITIDAKFAKAIADVVAENASEDTPVITRTTEDDPTKDTLFDQLKNDEVIAQDPNEDYIIELVIKEKDMNDEDKAKILTKMKQDTTIVQLYDIYIVVKDSNGNEITRIHEVPNEIAFEVAIPDAIAQVEEGKTRTYNILREHSEFEIIENQLSEDGKKLSFKSNKFSTFAIVYDEVEKEKEPEPVPGGTDEKDDEDEEIPEEKPSFPITGDDEETSKEETNSPVTGDNFGIWVTIFGFTFIAFIVARRNSKNRKYFNIM